ncbi:hypothetical protein [uncultured Tateyamaria sp.]|uniref:hypothetical protein n=1 Tax=uncultured Tateyamaria sp. TaxID=455651 RepID=UPI002625EDD6|nr:hypothetical protein [uncultured Tateyamaria sp.]
MDFGRINRGGKTKQQIRKDRRNVMVGVGKEMALVGIYAVKELTGVDMHRQPSKVKRSWEKKWRER